MTLLGRFAQLDRCPAAAPALTTRNSPRTSTAMLVSDATAGRALVARLRAESTSAIAVDSEFGFGSPAVALADGTEWHDVRSRSPICVAIAASCADEVIRAVLDVRQDGIATVVGEILRLRVLFVFHSVKAELFTFWTLGLDPEIHHLYDTAIVASCLSLGRFSLAHQEVSAAAIRAEKSVDAERVHHLSLVGQCAHYGLAYPFSDCKEELRRHFLDLRADAPLTPRMVEYAAADAEWTLRLHSAQQADILLAGVHHHLETVEFPFSVANARMEWNGVHVDRQVLARLKAGLHHATSHYADTLIALGVDPPGSDGSLQRVLTAAGVDGLFMRGGIFSTNEDLLEGLEHVHPAVRAFRLHRRHSRLARETWTSGTLIGADGRIHPRHIQLGAATGRNTCVAPNMTGIGRVLRPIVTAPPGRAIVEIDYSQIEIGVAAAEHGDPDLIAAYNSGDVYAAMAQRVYSDKLPDDERAMSSHDFKAARPDLRERMKRFVIGVLYNMQAPTLAAHFGISKEAAQVERDWFLSVYPALRRGLDESAVSGRARGHAVVVTGLRRHVAHNELRAENICRNSPIQGSATIVFKRAVVLLDEAFRGTNTSLILPVHDAIVIECDATDVEAVAERAAVLMRHALHAVYPALDAKVEVNASETSCWNKDGHADSLERFLADPTFRLDTALSLEGPPTSWPELWRERYEERAGILEYCAGMSREGAEATAVVQTRAAYEGRVRG